MDGDLSRERLAAIRGASWVLDAIRLEGLSVVLSRQLELLQWLRDVYTSAASLPDVSSLGPQVGS